MPMTGPDEPPTGPPAPAGYLPPVESAPWVGYGPPPTHYSPAASSSFPRAAQKTSVLAIMALVAIFVFTPAALVLGLVARSQINKTGEGGAWMAWTGIVVGALGTLVYLFGAFIVVAMLGGFEWLR